MGSVCVCGPVVWRDGNCIIIGMEPEMSSVRVCVALWCGVKGTVLL